MAECCRCGVTHRDLKPENLLLNSDGRIVIIDLGHAKKGEPIPSPSPCGDDDSAPPQPFLAIRTVTTNGYGTDEFRAPEASLGRAYDCQASDVWSVGVVAFYLHARMPVFVNHRGAPSHLDVGGPDNQRLWERIIQTKWYPPVPDNLRNFLNTLWQKDPTQRPSFEDLDAARLGDASALARFPGLRWLSQPTNSDAEFASELRSNCPGVTWSFGPAATERVEPSFQGGGVRRW